MSLQSSLGHPWLCPVALGMGPVCPSSECLFPPQPSDVETDSEEYKSQNDTETDLELEERDGTIMLKESSDLQVSGPAPCWLHTLS